MMSIYFKEIQKPYWHENSDLSRCTCIRIFLQIKYPYSNSIGDSIEPNGGKLLSKFQKYVKL